MVELEIWVSVDWKKLWIKQIVKLCSFIILLILCEKYIRYAFLIKQSPYIGYNSAILQLEARIEEPHFTKIIAAK